MRLVQFCSTKGQDEHKQTRYYFEPDRYFGAVDHPRQFRIEDADAAWDDVQQGIAWLNGDL